jgi:hypothetical protein
MTRLSQSWRAQLQRLLTVLLLGALTTTSVAAQTVFADHKPDHQAQQPNSSQTTFTYEGQLKDGSLPANGTYDLQFTLHTAQTGGDAPNTLVSERLFISNGLFKVELDFGSVIVTRHDHWLEVAVRPSGGAEAYAVLSPRQKLMPTPYAIFAQQDRWGLIGVPVGFAGGVEVATVSGDKVEDAAQTHGQKVGEPAEKGGDSAEKGTTAAKISATATSSLNTNFIAKFDLAGNATRNSMMYDSGTGVGLGTFSPTAPLHIEGTSDPQLRIVDKKSSGRNWVFGTGHNYPGDFVFLDATGNANVWRVMPGNSGAFVIDNRKVGIGTAYPDTQFHLAGSGDQAISISSTDPQASYTRLMAVTSNGMQESQLQFKNRFSLVAPLAGNAVMTLLQSGNVGIGSTNPTAPLHIEGTADTQFRIVDRKPYGRNWAFAIGHNNPGDFVFLDATGNANVWRVMPGNSGAFVVDNRNVGIGTSNPQAALDVAGTTRTGVLQITGGADLAEPFEINEAETIKPGMLVAIDPQQPGRLRLVRKAYDHTVAGVVSGANGIHPGLTMSQQGSLADGALPVALTGRVYCWVDAAAGPINPGDLLTTSRTPGHAMKVANRAKAQGAIIGKAMTGLKSGKGLVLVLVTLQ